MDLSLFSYRKFAQFALEETRFRTALSPRPFQENLKDLRAKDGKATLHTLSFKAPKIRHLRSLSIEGNPAMKVFDFAAFPEPRFDCPIFCANFFTTSTLTILVLDLNPLYDVTLKNDYKEKYYMSLLPLYQKYREVLPWGDKITTETLQFFSPIVLWSKISSSLQNMEVLYAAFKDYFKAWLLSMELAVEAVDESQALQNCEAQHKYLTWRAEKDPGHPLLKKIIGEDLARELLRNFLFEGVDSLSTKTFLEYFPKYSCDDGSINQKRSIIGKAYETRPWDSAGEFMDSKAL